MLRHFVSSACLFAVIVCPVRAQDTSDAAAQNAEETAAADTQGGATDAREPTHFATPPELVEFDLLEHKPTDYPQTSWAADEEGSVLYQLDVDAEGDVVACEIIESSGYEALDTKTCDIAMERGRFMPGTDENANAVASTYRDYQVWTKREPRFPATSTIHVQYTLTPQGSVADCEVIEVTGDIGASMRRTLEREPCPGANKDDLPPYRDEGGNPIAKRVDIEISVKVKDVQD